MKFDCGPTPLEKHNAKEQWHDWFAWHPVRLGSHDCRWMETVQRKGKFQFDSQGGGYNWKYKTSLTRDKDLNNG